MSFFIYSLTIHSVQFGIGQRTQFFFGTVTVNLFARFHCLIYSVTHIVYQFIPQTLHGYPEYLFFGIYFSDWIGASFPMDLSDDYIIPITLNQMSFSGVAYSCSIHNHLFLFC